MTDSRPVISRVSSESKETVIRSHVGKLARCDEDLSLIASEMTQLQDELTQFRAYADGLARRVSEREASLNQNELALSRLEEERTFARQQADGVSAELREAEARLSRHAQRVATLEHEVETLQAGIDEREHRLADHAVELSGVRDALPERARNPEQTRAIAKSAENGHAGHVRFIALPTGYGLSVSEEPCPRPGEFVEVDGTHFLVGSRGLSPLPGDARPCAFLWPGKS